METQLSTLSIIFIVVTYIVMFFLMVGVLFYISKKHKLKKRDFKTAFLVIGITFVVSFSLLLLYWLGIIFPIIIRILMGIFMLILTPFLIKKFYQTNWGKAIKVYLLMILISFLIMVMIFFVIGLLAAVLIPF